MAVEFISNMVGSTVNEFIDLALTVVTLMLVWYVIKFFIVEPKGKDESTGELGDWIKKKWGEKKEKMKKDEEAKERERLLEPVKGFILRVEQNADSAGDAISKKNPAGLRSAENHIGRIEDNLRSAKRVLRALKIKTKAPRRDYVSGLISYVEVMEVHARDYFRRPIPTNLTNINWNQLEAALVAALGTLKVNCGLLINSIDKFIDEDKLDVPTPRNYP